MIYETPLQHGVFRLREKSPISHQMDFDSFSSRIGTRQIEVAAPNTINQTITHCLWNLLLEHVLDLRENECLVHL